MRGSTASEEPPVSDELTDCGEVLARVYSFLDGELPDAEADSIRLHLTACDHCLDHVDVEQAMRALVRRCCTAERAPEALRLRVVTTMTATSEGVARTEYRSIEITESGH